MKSNLKLQSYLDREIDHLKLVNEKNYTVSGKYLSQMMDEKTADWVDAFCFLRRTNKYKLSAGYIDGCTDHKFFFFDVE